MRATSTFCGDIRCSYIPGRARIPSSAFDPRGAPDKSLQMAERPEQDSNLRATP
jgi:hypothetical protein